MKRIVTLIISFFAFYTPVFSQDSVDEYAILIYNLVISGNSVLADEFVDLNQYTAYIDRLETLPTEDKESLKEGAAKSYAEVRTDFNNECRRILELYSINNEEGVSFDFLNSTFTPSKNFPDIGMLTCFYIAHIPGDIEPVEDAFRFECIKTQKGWRILDGFFDDPEMN